MLETMMKKFVGGLVIATVVLTSSVVGLMGVLGVDFTKHETKANETVRVEQTYRVSEHRAFVRGIER